MPLYDAVHAYIHERAGVYIYDRERAVVHAHNSPVEVSESAMYHKPWIERGELRFQSFNRITTQFTHARYKLLYNKQKGNEQGHNQSQLYRTSMVVHIQRFQCRCYRLIDLSVEQAQHTSFETVPGVLAPNFQTSTSIATSV
jgi:hypothetical protein